MNKREANYIYKLIYNDLNKALSSFNKNDEKVWANLINVINLNIMICNGYFSDKQRLILTKMVDNLNSQILDNYIICHSCKNFCKQRCFA